MKNNKREKLVSVSIKDCIVQAYRGSGPGGQHRNKKETAIRVYHEPSKAEGKCENYREQLRNKKEAFKRMVNSKKFQTWLKIETSRKMGTLIDIDKKVEAEMKKIKIEGKNKDGLWEELE